MNKDEQHNASAPAGLVLEIQRMSTEDGPGIRTTVFFKGCNLKCTWCHNPESISPKPQVHWIGSRCIGCKTCVDMCPEGNISFSENGVSIDRASCRGCGSCAEECPSTALELLGKTWTVDDLVHEITKDRAYFEKSGGGITLSGGEPTMQPRFTEALLKALQTQGVHTALDTCGLCSREILYTLLPCADLVLFDIKLIDPERHRQFAGTTNEGILENLLHVSEYIRTHERPKGLWIRTPIIPGATATDDNITGIGRFIASRLGDAVERWELCAFNNLCRDKYIRLGLNWPFKDSELVTKATMERLAGVARKSGVNPDIVHWDGSTRVEDDDGEPGT